MTIGTSALLTAGLLTGLILAGSLVPARAADGRDLTAPQPRATAACAQTTPAVKPLALRTSAP